MLISVIFLKLFWIQIISTNSFGEHNIDLVANAEKQRTKSIEIDNGRGDILDRNGKSLLNYEMLDVVILFPFVEKLTSKSQITELAEISQLSTEYLQLLIKNMREPTVLKDENENILHLTPLQLQQVRELKIPGVIVSPYVERNSTILKHVIGYLAENEKKVKDYYQEFLAQGAITPNTKIGMSGLEKTFDRYLIGIGPTTLAYSVDGKGDPLLGLGIKYSGKETDPFLPYAIQTTIDPEIEKIIEDILKKYEVKEGAVVLLDANNADIIAMASKPDFEPLNVNPSNDNWHNNAVYSIEPGSIFKTVITAIVLENDLADFQEEFTCTGDLGKYNFTCWKKEGHGKLKLDDAFAESCNITYAKLAERITGDQVINYADKLGLIGKVGWQGTLFKDNNFAQIDQEEAGQVFSEITYPIRNDEGVLIQTAIGQRDVRVSPLAAANMMVTIINNGEQFQPRLVKEMRYKDGTTLHTFPISKKEWENNTPISSYTALELKRLLRLVVTHEKGTGRLLQSSRWPIAGKTGTAQTNISGKYHKWFVGFAPYDNPKYAIAVVVKNTDDTPIALNITNDIFNEIAR